jgi:hypothetical protein
MHTSVTSSDDWMIPEGTEIRSADDEKLGNAVSTNADFLVVEKGFVFPTDYYIPTTAITSFDGDKVHLSMTKDEVLHQGWDRRPATYVTTTTIPAGTLDADR